MSWAERKFVVWPTAWRTASACRVGRRVRVRGRAAPVGGDNTVLLVDLAVDAVAVRAQEPARERVHSETRDRFQGELEHDVRPVGHQPDVVLDERAVLRALTCEIHRTTSGPSALPI